MSVSGFVTDINEQQLKKKKRSLVQRRYFNLNLEPMQIDSEVTFRS